MTIRMVMEVVIEMVIETEEPVRFVRVRVEVVQPYGTTEFIVHSETANAPCPPPPIGSEYVRDIMDAAMFVAFGKPRPEEDEQEKPDDAEAGGFDK